MKVYKIAGIDIGSNSVRLLVSNVIRDKQVILYKKSSLTRLPIRLGEDAFTRNKISKKNIGKLITGLQAYQKIMDVHGVEYFRACATSALRESSNGAEVVAKVKEATGIQIDLIDGAEEAHIIFNSEMISSLREQEDTFLYIDVGGGSTELTFFHQNEIVDSISFKIGTIRLLNNMVEKADWEPMKQWIREKTANYNDILMVGSGGNINTTFKMSERRVGHPLSLNYLESTYDMLSKFTASERMIKFDLNPDRADVITHALRIYISAMMWARSERMLVPKKGLADGLVRSIFRQHVLQKSTD